MKREIAQQLQLPGDFVLGTIKVTVIGHLEACIENYKGILECSDQKIVLQTKDGQVTIRGKSLQILYYTCEEMKIQGEITDISYL